MLLAGLNALYTIFQDKIMWGGVRYKVLSATTCQVLGRITKATNNNKNN